MDNNLNGNNMDQNKNNLNETRPQGTYNVNEYQGAKKSSENESVNKNPDLKNQTNQNNQKAKSEYSGYGYNYNQTNSAKNTNPKVAGGQGAGNTPPKPQKKSNRFFGSIVAVAIACAVLGGGVGGAIVYVMSPKSSSSSNTSQHISIDGNYKSDVEAVAAKNLNSVVGVQISQKANSNNNNNNNPWYNNNGSDNSNSGNSKKSSVSEGSGVVYKADGYIITNYHVISSAVNSTALQINVYLNDNKEKAYEAKVIGYDAGADLAIIKIDATGLSAIEIGNSDNIRVGESAIAIGNPGGMEFAGSVSKGIISGVNRSITLENGVQMNLIQTDAAINPGNSGGALVDGTGALIGISSAKLASESFEGMGFAIPVNNVVSIADKIIANQGKTAPYLGITMDTRYTANALKSYGMPAGVVVASVADNSPASKAGLQSGDIITKFNDTATPSADVLKSNITNSSVGETAQLTVYRNNQEVTVQVTLGEATSQAS